MAEMIDISEVPTASKAQQWVRMLAAKGRIVWSKHCKERMREREITIPQILNCLLKGIVTEPPFLVFENGGGYEMRVEKKSAGDWLRVVVCLRFNQTLLIVTAINLS